jgi:hypothetical protein
MTPQDFADVEAAKRKWTNLLAQYSSDLHQLGAAQYRLMEFVFYEVFEGVDKKDWPRWITDGDKVHTDPARMCVEVIENGRCGNNDEIELTFELDPRLLEEGGRELVIADLRKRFTEQRLALAEEKKKASEEKLESKRKMLAALKAELGDV